MGFEFLPVCGWPTFPSVLWCCWLGLLTCKTVSRITYTVLVETLNPAQSNPIHESQKLLEGLNLVHYVTAGGVINPRRRWCERMVYCWGDFTAFAARWSNSNEELIRLRRPRRLSILIAFGRWQRRHIIIISIINNYTPAKPLFTLLLPVAVDVDTNNVSPRSTKP